MVNGKPEAVPLGAQAAAAPALRKTFPRDFISHNRPGRARCDPARHRRAAHLRSVLILPGSDRVER